MKGVVAFGHDEIESIIVAHMATWSKSDLSVQLGEGFLRHFYRRAVDDPDTLALAAPSRTGDGLACWCLGFRRYDAFNEALKRDMGWSLHLLIARRLLTGRLSIGRVLDQLRGSDLNRSADCPDNHLGAFGRLGGAFEDVMLLTELIGHTAAELCRDLPACWAVTDDRNRGAKTVMQSAGFSEIDRLLQRDRTMVVYEFSRP